MAIKLVRNNDGTYEYVDAASQSSKVNNLKNINNDFEAYESDQKTSLNQSTDIGTQTGQLIREMPGQTTTRFNDETGQFETTSATQAVNVEGFREPERTAESTALTPMQQVEKLTAATRPQSSTGSTDKVYELMARQQKLAEKAQQFNQLYKGADLAFNVYKSYKSASQPLSFTSIKGGSTLNPLSGFMGTNVGQSTVGGVGTAGMAGYGVSKILGGDDKQNQAAGVGSAIGMAVGGPVGGVVGGVIGSVFGCFLPNTKVTMSDGTTKNIIDINLNDNISIGGRVFAHAKFLITDLYDYKGVKVSGSHMVNEDNKWLRVEESKLAKSLGNKEHTVYTLGTDNRRILINNILFTDYFEVDEKKELQTQGDEYFNNWKNHSIELQEQNKNILNAI